LTVAITGGSTSTQEISLPRECSNGSYAIKKTTGIHWAQRSPTGRLVFNPSIYFGLTVTIIITFQYIKQNTTIQKPNSTFQPNTPNIANCNAIDK
jgi:hypothetical protein